jgi:acetoacetyl-CoA synthetase
MNPLTPVYVGGTQGPILGVPVKVFDALLPSGEPGKELPHGQPGELVATSSFPNIPVFFWGDKHSSETTAPPGSRYHSSYFARFPHVWAHGDFICIHPVTGSVLFLGRADGVLNPSGIRFGSAEIYGVIERRFADRVADSLCVGQRRPKDQDEAVMLFLLMRKGHKFDQKLAKDIREAIRSDLSKRHVPKWIFETPDIPVSCASSPVSPQRTSFVLTAMPRTLSMGRRLSCQSSKSSAATPLSRVAHWPTRRV